MNKKKIIIIGIIALVVIAIGIYVLIAIRNQRMRTNGLFDDSDYPVTYTYEENTLVVNLDGSKTPTIGWEVKIDNEEKVEVTQEGKAPRTKAKYVIKPTAPGLTRVRFIKAVSAAGHKLNIAEINIPIYVGELGDGFEIQCLDDPYYIKGYDVIGGDTDYPVILNNATMDGEALSQDMNEFTGNIVFLNGQNDWVLNSPDAMVDFSFYEEEGRVTVYISKGTGIVTDPEEASTEDVYTKAISSVTDGTPKEDYLSVDVKEATFTISSESLGISKNIKVNFNEDASVASVSLVTDEEKDKK